jgi:thiol-disulfide isomerase/thioredoxin
LDINVAGGGQSRRRFFVFSDFWEETEVHRRFLGLIVLMVGVAGCLKPASDSAPASNTTHPESIEVASPEPAESPASESVESGGSGISPQANTADGISLEVVDIDGYRQALAKHRGKVIFVDFWATWCPPCMENFPHTVHISRAFPADEVAVMSVSFDEPEDKDKALLFLQKQESRFDNFITTYGAGTEGTEVFEIDSGVPHYKIYDREGNVAKTLAPGPDLEITLELLDAEIRKVLEGSGDEPGARGQ